MVLSYSLLFSVAKNRIRNQDPLWLPIAIGTVAPKHYKFTTSTGIFNTCLTELIVSP